MAKHLDANKIAAAIVRAELADNYFLADLLRKTLKLANRQRRAENKPAIRATQHWYFDLGGNAY